MLGLLGVRFGPAIFEDWCRWTSQRNKQRHAQQKKLELKKQRELLERLKEARNRRLY
jgi:hypothetical protein